MNPLPVQEPVKVFTKPWPCRWRPRCLLQLDVQPSDSSEEAPRPCKCTAGSSRCLFLKILAWNHDHETTEIVGVPHAVDEFFSHINKTHAYLFVHLLSKLYIKQWIPAYKFCIRVNQSLERFSDLPRAIQLLQFGLKSRAIWYLILGSSPPPAPQKTPKHVSTLCLT